MKRILSAGFAVALTLAAAGFAGAQSSDDKMGTMQPMNGMKTAGTTVKIDAQNGSGESGTATLTPTAGGMTVKLNLMGASGDQPAHIHKGTCANLDPKPAYPLTTATDGKSTTTIKGLKMSTLTSGPYAINVHKSTTDLKDYVACGDITAAK